MLRIARSIRPHTRSRLDSNDTSPGKAVKYRLGRVGSSRAESFASNPVRHHYPRADRIDFRAQVRERNIVRVRLGTNKRVTASDVGEKLKSDELAKPATQTVPVDSGVFMSRNDEPDSWLLESGGGVPDVEVRRLHSPTLPPHDCNVRLLRQSLRTRKAESATLRRISSEAERSAVSDPSSCACSELHVPISLPFACGIRASGCVACCGDDMLAYPFSYCSESDGSTLRFVGRKTSPSLDIGQAI